MNDMNPQIEARHALSPDEIDAIEDRLYEYNSQVTGRYDGQGLAFMIRDELGRMIGVAAGYTWAGTSELNQMWVAGMRARYWTLLSRRHAAGVLAGFG
jgi:hypothetical protein